MNADEQKNIALNIANIKEDMKLNIEARKELERKQRKLTARRDDLIRQLHKEGWTIERLNQNFWSYPMNMQKILNVSEQ